MRLIFFVLLITSFATLAEALSPEQCVEHYATVYRVPPELIAAFIDVESGWNPHAVSDKGAIGLMQLMPTTARRFEAMQSFDVEQNIAAGTRYVTTLMWEFHGDLRLVAGAYHPLMETVRSPAQDNGGSQLGSADIRRTPTPMGHSPYRPASLLPSKRHLQQGQSTELVLHLFHPSRIRSRDGKNRGRMERLHLLRLRAQVLSCKTSSRTVL